MSFCKLFAKIILLQRLFLFFDQDHLLTRHVMIVIIFIDCATGCILLQINRSSSEKFPGQWNTSYV